MKLIISAIFKTLVLSLAIIAQVNFAYAQTQGGIIPNGKTTFLDANGNPLSSGKVFFYIPSTTTPKATYQDINQTISNTNPVILDAAGRALIWGTGNYRQIVQDQNNNVIWDVTTSVGGSGSSGSTATGDGDLVGTIKPWAGMTAPNQYMFTNGQQVSRTTFSALFTAITSTQNVFCTNGNPTLASLSDTTNFWIGMTVEVACVPGGVTTIINKTFNSVTMAVNANASQNISATFFPWGNGNGSTTFTLPDYRGIIPVGNNNMGGVASSNLTTTYFGNTNPNSSGALGGNQSSTLITSNVPPITSTGFNFIAVTPVGRTQIAGSNGAVTNAAAGAGGFFNSPQSNVADWAGVVQMTGANTITVATIGTTSTPFSNVPPSKTVNFIIKVTPDANSASASGVTSLGGMTGSIACGTNVTCTGNTISVVSTVTNITSSSLTITNPSSTPDIELPSATGPAVLANVGTTNTFATMQTPQQFNQGGFTGSSHCGEVLADNAASIDFVSMNINNLDWAILCTGLGWVGGVGWSADGSAMRIINITSASFTHRTAFINFIGGVGGCTATGVSDDTHIGCNEPDFPCAGPQPGFPGGTPTDCYLYLVGRTTADPPNGGIASNNWGIVWGRRDCHSGPGPTVQAVYPYYTCYQWNRTAGAATVGGDQFLFELGRAGTLNTFTGVAGVHGAPNQIANGIKAQWTGLPVNNFVSPNAKSVIFNILASAAGHCAMAVDPTWGANTPTADNVNGDTGGKNVALMVTDAGQYGIWGTVASCQWIVLGFTDAYGGAP